MFESNISKLKMSFFENAIWLAIYEVYENWQSFFSSLSSPFSPFNDKNEKRRERKTGKENENWKKNTTKILAKGFYAFKKNQ